MVRGGEEIVRAQLRQYLRHIAPAGEVRTVPEREEGWDEAHHRSFCTGVSAAQAHGDVTEAPMR